MNFIIKKIEKYLEKKNLQHHSWRLRKSKEFINHSFLFALPHIIVTLILILIFPEKWFGILILGIFLSDFLYALRPFITLILGKQTIWTSLIVGKNLSYLSHAILLSTSIILLLNQEYTISLSGFIHIFMDLIGF